MILDRRLFLGLMASAVLAGGSALLAPAPVFAKDGGGESDHGGGDDGGGEDKGGDDNGGRDDDGNEGKTGGRGKSLRTDQDEALDALKKGRIISLEKALAIAGNRYAGRVIDVRLTTSFGRPIYGIKVRLDQGGQIKSVRIDARTGKLLGFLGL